MEKFKTYTPQKNEKEELSLQEILNHLNNNEKAFFELLYSKLNKEDSTIEKVIAEIITKENLSFEINGNMITMILPDGQRIEMSSDASKKLINSGLGGKVFVNAVIHKSKRSIVTKEQIHIIDQARGGHVYKPGLIVLIDTFNKEIKNIDHRVKVKRELIDEEPLRKEQLLKEIEELKEIRLELIMYIHELEEIIKKYEEELKRIEEEKEKEKVIGGDTVNQPTPTNTVNNVPIKKVIEETKKEYDEEEKNKKRKYGFIGLGTLAALALGLGLIIKPPVKPVIEKEETTIEETTEEESEQEQKETEEIPTIETEPETEEEPTKEEPVIDFTEEKDEFNKEVYQYYYNLIIENIHPGEVTRELQDAYDGWNEDQGILGRDKTKYSYNVEKNIKPGADYVNRYNEFIEKYDHVDVSKMYEMIAEGQALLDEYQRLVNETSTWVEKHNESTQEVMDAGLCNQESYEAQKVLTIQQQKDLMNESANIDKVKNEYGMNNYDSIMKGIEEGKYEIEYSDDGIVTIRDTESDMVIVTSINMLLNGNNLGLEESRGRGL